VKKILIGLLVVIVLLGGALVIAPSFIDWNKERDQITELASDFTGREVKITGDISAAILPTPRLAISGLEVASIEGTKEPYLARIKSIEVVVALMPLFSGDVQIESVFVEAPDIALERLSDGRANWQFELKEDSGKVKSSEDGESGLGSGVPLSLDKIILRNGRIVFLDAVGQTSEVIENIQFTASMKSLTGPYAAVGDLSRDDLTIAFDVNVGRTEGDIIPLRADFSLKELANASIGFAGQAALASTDGAKVNGTLEMKTDDLSALLVKLQSGAPANPMLKQSLKAIAAVKLTESKVDIGDLRIEFGAARAEGAMSVAFKDGIDVNTDLELRGLNLDELIAAASGQNDAPAPAKQKSNAASQPFTWPVLPNNVKAALKLKANGITYRQALIRQTNLEAKLADGKLELTRLSAFLPGGSDVNIALALGDAKSKIPLRGRLEMASGNLRGLLGWLGMETDAPSGRMTNFTANIDIEGQQDIILARRINLRLDGSAVTGSASYRLQDRPSFGLNLSADKLNLDGYMPAAKKAGNTNSKPVAGKKAALDLSPLGQFDADIKIALKQLTYQRKTLRGLRLDAQLFDGKLTIRDVAIGNIGGGSAKITGQASNLSGQPNADLRLTAKAGNLANVAAFLGANLGIPPSRLNNFSLDVGVKGDAGQFMADGKAGLAGAKLSFNAQVKDLADAPNGNASFDLSHPSLSKLSKNFGLGLKPGKDGPVTITGDVKGSASLVSLDLLTNIAAAKVAVIGTLSDLASNLTFKYNISATGTSMVNTMAGLGLPYRAVRKGDHVLKLKAKVEGNRQAISMPEISGVLGQTEFDGTISVDLARATPYAKAKLKLGGFVVDEFMKKSARTSTGGRTKRTEARWSRNALDFSALKTVDADIDLSAGFIHFEPYRLKEPKLGLTLKAGVLTIEPLTARLFDGQIKATGKLDTNNGNKAGLNFALENIQLQPAIKAMSGVKNLSGSAESSGALVTRGRSEWEFVRNLAGNVKMRAWDGAIEKIDLKRARNAFRNMDNPALAVQEVAGAIGQGRTRFLEILGDWVIKRGVATTDNIASDFEVAYGSTRGNIDFPRWLMKLTTDLRFSRDHKDPDIVVVMKGPIDAPKSKVETDMLKNVLGGLLGSATGAKSSDGETVKPEDQLKSVLDGLLGKKKRR
jgi:uncharacterized protein involved in outer membrane biogenesis